MKKALFITSYLSAFICGFIFSASSFAGETPSREIKLKGDLLIMPLVDRNDCSQKPIPGKIKIYADDKLLGEIEGQLEPFPESYALRPHGTVPTLIEIFNHNKLLERMTSRKPMPDLSELSADGDMDVRFDVYRGKDTLMHRITGKMKKIAFKDRRVATMASHKKDTSVVSILADARHPVDRVPVKIGLTGTLVLEEVSEVPDAAKKHADMGTFEVLVDGQLVHRISGPHPRNPKDAKWWGFLDMKEYKGKTAVLQMTPRGGMTPEICTQILSRFESSDKMRHVNPVYKESGRPQFHFSQIQGWNNDPNGMVYSDGLWHISWQCDPLDKGFGGWYWGHAVSKDLIHWQEAPRSLRSHGGEEENRYPGMAVANCFSGSAAVDINNTLGVQKGKQKTIVAAFTDSPFGDSLAYSTDGGFRYNVMNDINNIIVHPAPEGVKSRGSYGRDPNIFWYEPTKKWIIISYRMARTSGSCSGYMVFYSSSDLKTWKEESITEKIFSNDYKDKSESSNRLKKDWHECPEFVELPVDGNRKNMKWVLMDSNPKYQVGEFDGKTFTPDKKEYRWGIFGRMKAAQAFSNAPDGRAVLMIWARMNYGADAPFASGFTLPLELSLRTADDGIRMYANPVKELEQLRVKELCSIENKPIGGEDKVVSYDADTELVEVVATIKTDSKSGMLEMKFGEDVHYYHLKEKQLGDNENVANIRDHAIVHDKEDGKIDVHVYIDRASWEIFMENGSVYKINSRKNIGAPVGKISFALKGAEGEVESMKVYQLKSIWPEKSVDTLVYSIDDVK